MPEMMQGFKDGESKWFEGNHLPEGWNKGSVHRPHPAPPASTDAKEAERLETIRQGVSLVLEAGEQEDINVNGAPDIRAVEKVLGFDITAKERDLAYAEVMQGETQ